MEIKKLLTRTLSGIIYIALFIGAIVFGEDTLVCLSALLSILACLELERISGYFKINKPAVAALDCIACVLLVVSAYQPLLLFAWIFTIMVRMITELYLNSENHFRSLTTAMTAQIYIALPMSMMVVIGNMYGTLSLLPVLFLIWINDTGAFLIGCTIGKHRLFERISPKKSWEGFFGGLCFNIAFSLIFCKFCSDYFFSGDMGLNGHAHSYLFWIGLAVIVTIFSTWGDLIESLIKRTFHIKDSGSIIPGHGGILDRIDSLLLVLPAVFIFYGVLAWFFTPLI